MLVKRRALSSRSFLFKSPHRSDPKRQIWTSRNGEVDAFVEETSRTVTHCIANALRLGGKMYRDCTQVIASFQNAATQSDHVDTKRHGAYSFLIAVTPRFIHVTDQGSSAKRTLHLRAGDVLVLQQGVCHAAHSHILKRCSLLVFTAWNWEISDEAIFC